MLSQILIFLTLNMESIGGWAIGLVTSWYLFKGALLPSLLLIYLTFVSVYKRQGEDIFLKRIFKWLGFQTVSWLVWVSGSQLCYTLDTLMFN